MDVFKLSSEFGTVWPIFNFLFIELLYLYDQEFFNRILKVYYTLNSEYFWENYGQMKFCNFHPAIFIQSFKSNLWIYVVSFIYLFYFN
jgi:hypothetical protein